MTRRAAYLLLCFVTRAAAAELAFQANTSSGFSLRVYADDSYTLGPADDSPWLVSGPLGFHHRGVWFTNAASAAPDVCSPLENRDCHGDDISFFNTTSAAACCAACNSTPGCGAWTLTGVTESSISTDAPPPWAGRCYLKNDCNGGMPYGGHTSGVRSASSAPLQRVGGTLASGTDPRWGAWSGYALSYMGGAGSDIPFTASFKFFAALDAIVFEHAFPAGIDGLNTTTPSNTTTLHEFASSTAPATAFPSWVPGPAPSAASLGSATWAGRFAYTNAQRSGGAAGALAAFGGAEGGPVVIWPPPTAGAPPASALVLSPSAHFHGTILGRAPPGAPSSGGCVGINSYVLGVPPGFTVASVAVGSSVGITDAMHAWGSVLQRAYGTAKIEDPSASLLSYWTDNGALLTVKSPFRCALPHQSL